MNIQAQQDRGGMKEMEGMKNMKGMNRISRLLPYLGAASDSALPHTHSTLPHAELPLLDGRDLRAMVAHCVKLGDLINFFETADTPFGTWGDILHLLPCLAAACLLEEAAAQEKSTKKNRPARIAALAENDFARENQESTALSNTSDTSNIFDTPDTLIQEELNWQNIWITRLEKAGVFLDLPPFPQWPKEQTGDQTEEQIKKKTKKRTPKQELSPKPDHATHVSHKAYQRDAALRIALRRSLLLEAANALWDKAISNPEGKLAPHAGMLLAFLERYALLQQACNNLVPLHSSYFYEKVMGFSPQAAMPDRVLACFHADPKTPWSTVPAGSLLTTSNQGITFTSENSVPFSQIALHNARAIIPTIPSGPFTRSALQEEKEDNSMWTLFKDAAASPTVVGSSLFTLQGMKLMGGLRELIFKFTLEAQNDTAISNLKKAWALRPKDFATVTISGDGAWLTPSAVSFSLSFPTESAAKEPFEKEPFENPPCEHEQTLLLTKTTDKECSDIMGDTANPLRMKRQDVFNTDTEYFTLTDRPDCAGKLLDKAEKTDKVLDEATNNIDSAPVLFVSLTIEADSPSILPPQEDTHGLSADHPVMRFVPHSVKSPLWQAFNAFSIKNMRVDMTVRGLRTCELTVDGTVIPNPDEGATAIFGVNPASAASFVLNVSELSGKSVNKVNMRWQWEAPERFTKYFAKYPFTPLALSPATRNNGEIWHETGQSINFSGRLPQNLHCPIPKSKHVTAWRWTLSTEGSLFGQADYPRLLAQAVLTESSLLRRAWARLTGGLRLKDLKPPLLPSWTNISIDYEASIKWDVNAQNIVTHEHPWAGMFPRHPTPPRLFPHYDKHSLSLGFDLGTETCRNIPLSLYFCLQNLAPDGDGPSMHAHGADIFKDNTKGLIRSGIMELMPHSDWPNGLSKTDGKAPELFHIRFDWLEEPRIALQGIHEHAVWATYAPEDENALHARSFPLPTGSLKGVNASQGAENISLDFSSLKLVQPYPSIGGRPQSGRNAGAYRQGCAEELSHRGQAILPRDFERLVLRDFPDVLTALCVSHSSKDLTGTSPGAVALVIFSPQEGAKIHAKRALNDATFTLDPYLPTYADAEYMQQIASYMDSRSSPYARLTLMHPVYRKVHGNIRVWCDPMKNPLDAEREIRHFLEQNIAPWAFEPSTVMFGRTLDIVYLQTKLESFPWVLGVEAFILSTELETPVTSLQSAITSLQTASAPLETANAPLETATATLETAIAPLETASAPLETATAYLQTTTTDKGKTIVAGTGSLLYPGKLHITCIRDTENRHDQA